MLRLDYAGASQSQIFERRNDLWIFIPTLTNDRYWLAAALPFSVFPFFCFLFTKWCGEPSVGQQTAD
jgi:hypothetical protein